MRLLICAHLQTFVCRVSVSTVSRIWITVEIMNFKSLSQRWHVGKKPLKLIFFLKIMNIFLLIRIWAVEKHCPLFLCCAYGLLAAECRVPATACPVSLTLQRLLPDKRRPMICLTPTPTYFHQACLLIFRIKAPPLHPFLLSGLGSPDLSKANKLGFEWPVQPVTRCSSFPSQTHSKVTNLFNSFCGWEGGKKRKKGGGWGCNRTRPRPLPGGHSKSQSSYSAG